MRSSGKSRSCSSARRSSSRARPAGAARSDAATASDRGSRGRLGIYEMVSVNPDIHDAILQRASAQEMSEMARRQGARTLARRRHRQGMAQRNQSRRSLSGDWRRRRAVNASWMPTFTYSALSSLGQSVSGELVAEHERAALRELKRRGLMPLSLAIAAAGETTLLILEKTTQRRGSYPSAETRWRYLSRPVLPSTKPLISRDDRRSMHIFGDALDGLGRDLRRGVSVPEAVRANINDIPCLRVSADRSRQSDRHP